MPEHGFPPLDQEPGPAPPLAPEELDRTVERVVSRLEPRRRQPRVGLVWYGLAAIVVAASAGAVTLMARRPVSVPASEPSAPGGSAPLIEAPPSATSAVDRPSPPAPRASVTPADRLGLANDLRRAGRWRDSEAAYLAIATDYPAAPEAYVATLAAAALRLEHLGDPAGALKLYQTSSRRGPLGVEALFGVARAERALGRSDAEVAALRAVIQAYPESLQADRARRRLGELRPEGGPP
jgi:tetratricopeptide (TPR) repeat protein